MDSENVSKQKIPEEESPKEDQSDEELEPGFSLSSILFGNVNKDGELIDGFFDKVSLRLIYLDRTSGIN